MNAAKEALARISEAFGQLRFFRDNCHSIPAVGGAQGEGGAGMPRADFVLGDRDGASRDPAFTGFVRATLAAMGYEVKVNDPYKGVELVRAYSNPRAGPRSLQIEINKRAYMDEATREKRAGFAALRNDLATLAGAMADDARRAANAARGNA